MRIIVMGCGAIGSILAAHASSAGAQVTVIARGRRAELLRNRGIEVTGLTSLRERCHVTTKPAELQEADILVIAVKTYDMERAMRDVSHLRVGAAMSIQNGVVKNEQLAKVFGKEKVLGAVAQFSGDLESSGSVRFTLNENLFIGVYPHGISQRVDWIVRCLADSGLHATAVSNIQTIEWSKFVTWVSLMSLATLTRMKTWEFLSDWNFARVGVRIMRETALLAASFGVALEDVSPMPVRTILNLPESDAIRKMQEVGHEIKGRAPNHKVSSLQDLEKGRRLEVEDTLGFVVSNAANRNIPVPSVETVYHLLRGLTGS